VDFNVNHLKSALVLRGYKTHKRLIIKQVVKRFGIKKGRNTEGFKNVFKSAEVIAELNRKVNAIEGGQQTLNKLETYLNHLLIVKK
jgi:hypothetical protein